jgi:hypothetical protein
MKIDTRVLETFKKFGDLKNLYRQRVYKLVEAGKLNSIDIDGVRYIIMNQKAILPQ